MKKRLRIREKIHRPLVFVGFSALLIFAIANFFIIRNQVNLSIKKQATSIADIFSSSIQDDILNGLDTEVYRKCLAIFENSLVSEVSVLGLDSRKICKVNKPSLESDFILKRTIKFYPGGSENAGQVTVGFQTSVISNILIRTTALLIVLIFFLSLIYWLMSRKILISETKKFENLSDILSRSNIDELEECSSILEEDQSIELIELCDGIEKLALNWRAYEKELVKNEKLKAASEQKERISKQVAHDIRSPLGALRTAKETYDEQKEASSLIMDKAIQRIIGIVDDLQVKKSSAYAEIVSVNQVVREILQEKRSEYLGENIKLYFDSSEEDVFVSVEKLKIMRVLSNLINNSIEAKSENDDLSIKINVKKENERVKISICDNGIGISPEDLSRVTDYGFTKGKEEGSGTGLAHAKASIQEAGGSFSIHSEKGVGTSVLLVFDTVFPDQQKSP